MNQLNLMKVILSIFLTTCVSGMFAQVLDVNTQNRLIEGAVDGQGNPTQTLAEVLGQNFSVLRISASGVTIRNVIINANGQQYGIHVNGQPNVVIDNVVVHNANNHGIYVQGSVNASVVNSTVYNNGLSQNVSAAWWTGVNGYNFYDNQNGVREMTYAGIYVDGNNSNSLLIDNNTIYGNHGHGIKMVNVSSVANGETYSAIISNNLVGSPAITGAPDGNFGDGILLTTSRRVQVNGNITVANGNRDAWDNAPGNIATDANSGLDNRNFYGAGIELNDGGNHTVTNNFVGTYTGENLVALYGVRAGNHKHGIYVRTGSDNNQIGLPNQGNIVGNNGYAFQDVHTKDSDPATNLYLMGVAHGITLHDDGAVTTQNKVQGNHIGYYNGNCIPNRQDGVSILGFYAGGATLGNFQNTIGGAGTGEGNIIAGGMFGIFAQGPTVGYHLIQGNFIGTDGPAMTDIGCPLKEGGVVAQNGSDDILITKNYIAYISDTFPAIEIKNSTSINNRIYDNYMKCNGDGIRLSNAGNANFGVTPRVLAVNTLGSDSTKITGVSPNANDRIDVYIADSCKVDAKPCQNTAKSETAVQGLKYITTINASANNVLTTRTELGYFNFDLTSAIATTNGLTYQNVVLAARVFNSNATANTNTSEFHKCIAVALCKPPQTVTITTPLANNLCTGGTATITATFTKEAGDNSPNSDFRFVLHKLPNQTTAVAENTTGTFTVTESGQYKVSVYNIKGVDVCRLLSAQTVTVTIQGPVTPGVISKTTPGELCQGQTNVQFSVTGSAGSTFRWTKSDDASWVRTGTSVTVAQVTQNFTLTVIETTAATFSCPQTPVPLDVVVRALPGVVTITGDNDVCEGETTTYSVPVQTGYTYVWSVSAADAVVTPNGNQASVKWGKTSGTVSVRLTNEFGCQGANPSTMAVTVNTLPTPRTITGTNPACAGSTQSYQVSGSATGSTFAWTQDGSALSSTTNSATVTIPETATTVLNALETTAKGCKALNPSTITVNINKRPIPLNLRAIPSPDVCIGNNYQVAVDVESGVVFNWSANPSSMITGNSTANQLNLVASVSGTITVGATNTVTGCASNASERKSIDITVRQLPVRPVVVGKDPVTCSATETYSVQTPNATSRYIWYYGTDATGTPAEGDTTTITTSTVDFGPRRAEVQVKEISQYGCVSEIGQIIPAMTGCDPKADFVVDAPSYCLGEPVRVTEQATYTPANIEPLTMWFYFTGANVDSLQVQPGGSVTVTYAAPGSYPIKMVIKQAGKTDVLDSMNVVVIKPLPTIATQTLTGDLTVCQNFSGTYTIANPDAGATYNWTFAGATELAGSTNTSKNLKFGPSSNDVIIKIVENRNGCIDSLKTTVDVLPTPNIRPINGANEVCEGQPLVLTLGGNAPTTSQYTWTPAANITSTNATKTEATFVFPTAGTYEVTVLETDANGCFSVDSTSKKTIRVKDIPNAPIITGAGLEGICAGQTANFSSAANTLFTYNWSVPSPDQITSNNGNSIVVTPNGTGTKTVALSVTLEGCTSAVSDTTYEVQAIPNQPLILPNAQTFCEGEEVEYSIQNPNTSSKYCWTIPAGASIVNGESSCPPTQTNDKITIKFGANGGTISAIETTSFGCASPIAGTATATVQQALGSFEEIASFTGEICSSASYDSLAHYEVKVQNATSVSYFVTPATTQTFTQTGSGDSKMLDVVFATPGNYVIKAVALGGTCFEDSTKWNVTVKEPVAVSMSIDNRDVCDGDDAEYTVTLSPNVDAGATFKWYLNNKFEANGQKITIGGVNTGDEIRVDYTAGAGFCADIANSEFSNVEDLKVWSVPNIDMIVSSGDGIEEKFDENGLYYQIKDSKTPLNLEGMLNNVLEEGSVYNYTFYWKDGANQSFSNIEVPSGTITDFVQTGVSMSDILNSQRDRIYVFEVDVNGICPATAQVTVKVNYDVDIKDAVCFTCGTGNWTIENIDKFTENTVVIFNRWGTIVRTFAPGEFGPAGWDGTSDSGEPLPVGAYFYTVVLSSEHDPCTGPLTLLR
jgi:gliding motility-associated-like protein